MPSIFSFLPICLIIKLSVPGSHGNTDGSSNNMNTMDINKYEVMRYRMEDFLRNYEKFYDQRLASEKQMCECGGVVDPYDKKAPDLSSFGMKPGDPSIRKMESTQLPFEELSCEMLKSFNISRDTFNQMIPILCPSGPMYDYYREICINSMNTEFCDISSRYRTFNGYCNNFYFPSWGSAMSCQQRLLPPYYEGNSEFRRSVKGGPLPNPRTLSLNLHSHMNRPSCRVSHMFVMLGQFLDHDIALTPSSRTVDNQAIQCCPVKNETHPQCAPIIVPDGDPIYPNGTCWNFVRSAICPTCGMDTRVQINSVTAFIDTSLVYGNSADEAKSLKENGTGKLKTQKSDHGDILPCSVDTPKNVCMSSCKTQACLIAGDPRVNQHTTLASLHVTFMRLHNKLAEALTKINPHWDDEKLYQESRRIVIALFQSIIYKEYVPLIVGSNLVKRFNLGISCDSMYNPWKNPATIEEFSTSCFRLHTMINTMVGPINNQKLFRDDFFRSLDLCDSSAGSILEGAAYSPSQSFDRFMDKEMTNFLYKKPEGEMGLDISAINIHRGRDNGMPPYVDVVNYCSGIQISNFEDLFIYGLMSAVNAEALEMNYKDVKDVDLWTGCMMETPREDAVLGPTCAYLNALQFNWWKEGDRFFFTHAYEAGSFTPGQCAELQKATLAGIICSNTDAKQMPKNAMLLESEDNPSIPCKNMKDINLDYWKDP